MHTDIVLACGNEPEFAAMAQKLGYSTLVFAYSHLDELYSAPLVRAVDIQIQRALFISSSKKSDVVQMITKAQHENILCLVKAQHEAFNRFIVEKTDADSLVDVEYVHKKDHLHFRRSGLDQVMCQLAAKNKKSILSSFSQLLRSDKPLILGRIMQNTHLCRKYGVDYSLVSFAQHPFEMKGAHDMKALMTLLDQRERSPF